MSKMVVSGNLKNIFKVDAEIFAKKAGIKLTAVQELPHHGGFVVLL